jgi:hypothetical protein
MDIVNKLAQTFFYRVRPIRVRDCVHYCGFRYGRGEFNPYEKYFRDIASGCAVEHARAEFLDFILHHRPRNLGEALSLDIPNAPPLWRFPWQRANARQPRGWRETADEIPDVLTHFSNQGVPEQRIRDEYRWLDDAWHAMSSQGYRPIEHSYIRVFELASTERSAYIVADGNHRLAALSVLGIDRIDTIMAPFRTARRSQSSGWPAVRGGLVSEKDALRIFDVYFHGNRCPCRAQTQAPVVSSPIPSN